MNEDQTHPAPSPAALAATQTKDVPAFQPLTRAETPLSDGLGALCFGPSVRALAQRRWLALLLCLLLVGGLVLLLILGGPAAAPWLRWPLAVILALGLVGIVRGGLSTPLAQREVLIREQALELRRGTFRRLVVFENIRHIRTAQSPEGHLWSMRLDLEDDSVTLRDLEGLARVFAETAQRRPAGTLIEAQESHLDWGEPLPWVVALVVLGLLALAGIWWAGLL